jgi:hypothetical protein
MQITDRLLAARVPNQSKTFARQQAHSKAMNLPSHKTKIVCTIGPAFESPDAMKRMFTAGTRVARLNFSDGDYEGHRKVIRNLRTASQALGWAVAIGGSASYQDAHWNGSARADCCATPMPTIA